MATFKTAVLPPGAVSGNAAALGAGWDDAMQTVWENGELKRDWSFAEVRARSETT